MESVVAARAPSAGAAMDRFVPKRRRRWWRARLAGLAAGLLALALLLWFRLPVSGSMNVAATDIEIGTVNYATFQDYLPIRATVAPATTTFVTTASGGQIDKLLVQEGSRVAAGQPLATLINPTLKLDILTREADIAGRLGDVSAEELSLERNRIDRTGQISSANYDLLKAERDLSNHERLHARGIISDEAIKSYQAEDAYQRDRVAQLRSGQVTEDRIAEAQARRLADSRARLAGNLKAVQSELSALTVRAPVSGLLTDFKIQPGQMLKPGDTAGQIDSEGSWKLVADVDEFYLGRVAVGQTASLDGGYTLVVSKVLSAVTNGRFKIELRFLGQVPAGLSRGQTLDIRATLGKTHKALVAPAGGWLESGGGNSAYVLDAGGRHASRRNIQSGLRNPEQVEVISGLKPGDRIVTSNTSTYSNAAVLNVR